MAETVQANYYGPDIYVFDLERVRDRLTFSMGDSLAKGPFYDWVEERRPTEWYNAFVPWSHRTLMVPGLSPTVLQLDGPSPIRPPEFKTFGFGYVELQYWGPVTLDEVREFQFTGSPPSGEFLQELQRRGIPIFDSAGAPWTAP